MITALLAALLATSSPAVRSPFLCQVDLPEVGGKRVAWFNLNVGKSLEKQSSDLFVRTDDFEGQWNVEAGWDAPGSMTEFRYDLPVESDVAWPIKVVIAADDIAVGETTLREAQNGVLVFQDGSQRSVNSVFITESAVPNVHGKKRLSFSATDAAGRRLNQATLNLPDWMWLGRETARAAKAAERMRLSKQCVPSMVF